MFKIRLRADKSTIVGQKELIGAFNNGQGTPFLPYRITSSYRNFLKGFIKINRLPTQHHLSIDNLSLIGHEALSGTRITIVSQDVADRMLANDNIVVNSQKFRDVFIKIYAIIKVDSTYYQNLVPIIQRLKK